MTDDPGLAARLRDALGPSAVLTEAAEMEPYAVDWRRMFPGRPTCVARPASTQEVAKLVSICREAGVGIVPQGGNTGLAGGAVPDASGGQVVLSLSRMNAVRSVDPVGLTVEAEAGAILKTVQDRADDCDCLLPISLAAEGSATIGGVISTNAGGVNVLRYGMTRSLVLGLEVVLPDGRVLNGLRRLRKDNAGYDWKHLFIGTEGTLGVVTGAVLRLLPRPRHSAVTLLSTPDPGAAIRLLERAQREVGDTISAFELISGGSLALVEKHLGLRAPIAKGEWFVLIEVASSLPGLRDGVESLLEAVLNDGLAVDSVIAESSIQAGQLWALRETITEAEAREGRSLKHDISLPLDAIPAFLREAATVLAEDAPETKPNVFGHLGDGNLHYNVLLDASSDGGKISRVIHDLVAGFDGSISAEHGIGQYRVEELRRLRARTEQDFCLTLKRAIDPEGVFNPGKVFPARSPST